MQMKLDSKIAVRYSTGGSCNTDLLHQSAVNLLCTTVVTGDTVKIFMCF